MKNYQQVSVGLDDLHCETMTVGIAAIDKITIKGDSAYIVAVKNGFVGTEQEWLDSLSQASEDAAALANQATDLCKEATAESIAQTALCKEATDLSNATTAENDARVDTFISGAQTTITNTVNNANTATTNANNAATNANAKATLAQQAADSAKTQGDYAKAQGDYAKREGIYAKAQGDYAMDSADYAKAQGDFAESQAFNADINAEMAKHAADNANNAATNANNAATNANAKATLANTAATNATNAANYTQGVGDSYEARMVQLEQDVSVLQLHPTGVELYKSSQELSQYIELPFDMYLKKIRDKVPFSIQLALIPISKDGFWNNFANYILGTSFYYGAHSIRYQDGNGYNFGYGFSYNNIDWIRKLNVPQSYIITFDGINSISYVNGKAGGPVIYERNEVTEGVKSFLGVGNTGNGGGVFNSDSKTKTKLYLIRFLNKVLTQEEVDLLTNQGDVINADTTTLRANIEDEYIADNIRSDRWLSSGNKGTTLMFNNIRFVYDDFTKLKSWGNSAPTVPPTTIGEVFYDVSSAPRTKYECYGKANTEQYTINHWITK